MFPYYKNQSMDNNKHLSNAKRFVNPKNMKFNGKLKEILSARSKIEPKIPDVKDFANIPIIKQADSVRLLPKYASILARSPDDAVAMDDLDQLQQDLEKLLSTSAVRTRFFLGEIIHTDKSDAHNDKKPHDKTSLKRKRPDDKSRYKDLRNGMRVIKKEMSTKFCNDDIYKEIPKVTLPRNDNSDKFWASIEPYCSPVNKDDIVFLDGLIQEFSKDIDMKIPELGEHYANSWSDEVINDEQSLGKSPTKKPLPIEFRESGLHAMVETFATPNTQRLLGALIQERALKTANANVKNGDANLKINKIKSSELTKLKQGIGQKVGTCLDRRLLNTLVEQGILKPEDLAKNTPEDEIMMEIKKCQQELITVNQYNVDELNKLKSLVYNEIHCNELKDELDKIDRQILELYNGIIVARKKALEEEGKDFDNEIFSDQIISEFEHQADALLKQQVILNREINGLTDMSMLY